MGLIEYLYTLRDFFVWPGRGNSRKRRGEDISDIQNKKARCTEELLNSDSIHSTRATRDPRTTCNEEDIMFIGHRSGNITLPNWNHNGKENCVQLVSPSTPLVRNNPMDCRQTYLKESKDEIQVLEDHNHRFPSMQKRCKGSSKRASLSVCNIGNSCNKDDDVVELPSTQSACERKAGGGKVFSTFRTEDDVQVIAEHKRDIVNRNVLPHHRKPFKSVDPTSASASSTPIVFSSRRPATLSFTQPEIEVLPSPSLVNGLGSNHYQPLSSMTFSSPGSHHGTNTLQQLQKAQDKYRFDAVLCSSARRPMRNSLLPISTPQTPTHGMESKSTRANEVVVLKREPTSPRTYSHLSTSLRSLQKPIPPVKFEDHVSRRHIHVAVENRNESEASTSASRQVAEDSEIQFLGEVATPTTTCPAYEPNFIDELLAKYRKKDEENRKVEEETKQQCKLLEERNQLAHSLHFKKAMEELERDIFNHLHVVEEIPEEKEEDKIPALPELTPEMEAEIDKALTAPPDTILVNAFNLTVKGRDMRTLRPLAWLNDEVINFYMNLLIERGKGENYPSVHAFNTFFFPKLLSNGYDSLKRWTKKVDIFAHDLILVPVHRGAHWCMAIIDMKEKIIRYYDSMDGRYPQCADALLNYLQKESLDKKKQPFDTSGWQREHAEDIPQQNNGSDCGMFACMYAEYVSRGAPITFTQDNMPYFRRKAVYEILKARLLC